LELGCSIPVGAIPDTASRTLRRIKAVFDWCQVSGYRTANVNGVLVTMPNPCEAIRAALPKQNKKENAVG
jgi:hypothetical protein